MPVTVATHSRIASLTASFNVALPDRTGTTSAPSSRMRHTFSACRSTSTEPMYTVQSRPNNAAAVAVATPCCPAPVSAITRCLPMRRGEQRLSEHVVDLVRARVREVFALQQHAHAEPLREPRTLRDGRGAPGVGPEEIRELLAKRVVVPGPAELRFELFERVDQGLGRVATAELAEPAEADRFGARAIEVHGRATRRNGHTGQLR